MRAARQGLDSERRSVIAVFVTNALQFVAGEHGRRYGPTPAMPMSARGHPTGALYSENASVT